MKGKARSEKMLFRSICFCLLKEERKGSAEARDQSEPSYTKCLVHRGPGQTLRTLLITDGMCVDSTMTVQLEIFQIYGGAK